MSKRIPIKGSEFCQHLGMVCHLIDGMVSSSFTFNIAQGGPPGHAHGGMMAAVIDEAMGMAAWSTGKRCVAVNLNFSYKQPVPLGVAVQITGRIDRIEGRKVFTVGTITLPDDTIGIEGQGIFVEAPHLFIESYSSGLIIFGEPEDID